MKGKKTKNANIITLVVSFMRPCTQMRSLDIADRLTRGPWRNFIYLYLVFVHLLCVNAQN
jgi:hypothetical protein